MINTPPSFTSSPKLSCIGLAVMLCTGCATTMTPQQQQSTAFGMGMLRTALSAASLLQQPTTASARNTNAFVGIAAGVQLFSQVDGFLQKRPPTIISNQPFSRVARIANELARVSPRYGQTIQILVWPHPCVACTDDSRIFIDPGFADSLSDENLRAVLAHEMAHGDLGHTLLDPYVKSGMARVTQAIDPQARPITQLAFQLGTTKYDREQEVDADFAGAQYLERLGYGGESFAQTLNWMAAQGMDVTANWFSTHPSTPERAQRLMTALAARATGAIVQPRTLASIPARTLQKMLVKGSIAAAESDSQSELHVKVQQEEGPVTEILVSLDTKIFSGQREVALETIREKIGSPVEVAYTFNPATNEQKALLVELPAPPILIVFYKGIQIDGDRQLTYDAQDALQLLEKKSWWTFRDVQKYVGLVKLADQDKFDLTKQPAVLEVNSKTASQSTSWLASVVASGACHIRGQREERQHAERECTEYQYKVLKSVGASEGELDAVRQLVLAQKN